MISNRVLEYIIRVIDRTRAGTKSASDNVESMAKAGKRASRQWSESLSGLAAKIGMVGMAFKVGWDIGKKINEFISPTLRLAKAWETVSEQVKRSKAYIDEHVKALKDAIKLSGDVSDKGSERISKAAEFKVGMLQAGSTGMDPEEAAIRRDEAAQLKEQADRRVEQLRIQLQTAQREQARARLAAVGLSRPSGMSDKDWDAKQRGVVTAGKLADEKIDMITRALAEAQDAAADAANESTLAAARYAGAVANAEADAAKARDAQTQKRIKEEEAAERKRVAAAAEREKLAAKEADAREKAAIKLAETEHRARIGNIRKEADASAEAQTRASDRLARARSAAQQAWGWYRDPESFRAQLAEEKAEAAAQKQFAKDSDSLRRRTGWRTRELGAEQEAVRRVIFAREEEAKAREALVKIEQNTAGLKEMLETLLTSK